MSLGKRVHSAHPPKGRIPRAKAKRAAIVLAYRENSLREERLNIDELTTSLNVGVGTLYRYAKEFATCSTEKLRRLAEVESAA